MRAQISTRRVSIQSIMRSTAFARGVSDVRAGRPLNYDSFDDDDPWSYERGRQWAYVAPMAMPLRIGRTLNPKAIALADAAFDRRYII